jgi:hypothetical protein
LSNSSAPRRATDVDHPNLASWRTIAAERLREVAAVFIALLDDPIAGRADAALRALIVNAPPNETRW